MFAPIRTAAVPTQPELNAAAHGPRASELPATVDDRGTGTDALPPLANIYKELFELDAVEEVSLSSICCYSGD